MSEFTAEKLAQLSVQLNLLTEGELSDVWSELGRRNVSPEEFIRVVERRQLLTNYQVERMLKGETRGFFYGHHKVLYLVGTGTFSRVYRCENIDNGEIVAVKVLRSRFSEDENMTQQFFREGEMGRKLRHPNIVPIYEVYSKGLTHYLAMEFVEGRNLREFVKTRKKIAPLEAVKLTSEIAAGLSYAFVHKVCHRDLKMTNVLVSSSGHPKLVDFGLASGGDVHDGDHVNPRTIDYAGLERATGVRKDDMRSDIFFLGCMMYNMLTGRAPLVETKDRTARLSKSRYLEIPPIVSLEPDLPVPVVAVVTKAMEINVDKRYQTPTEMLLDLKNVINRLEGGGSAAASGEAGEEASLRSQLMGLPNADRRSVLVVESDAHAQDVIRNGLKRVGYRVLMTQSPERAFQLFANSDKPAADCVVFSTGDLGLPAVEAFNRFGEDPLTQKIPAVLLLGQNQAKWQPQARLADHRIVVFMPIKLKEFRQALAKLMPPRASAVQ
jgi:serine/threonine-protein kinase